MRRLRNILILTIAMVPATLSLESGRHLFPRSILPTRPLSQLNLTLDPAVEKGLAVLQASGQIIHDILLSRFYQSLFAPDSHIDFDPPWLFEGRLGERLPVVGNGVYTPQKAGMFVHRPNGRHRTIHAHFHVRSNGHPYNIGSNLSWTPEEHLQSPGWFDHPSWHASTAVDFSIRYVQIKLPISDFPAEFESGLKDGYRAALGDDWVSILTEQLEPGPFFSAVPLLSDPDLAAAFRERLKVSPELRQWVAAQKWAHQGGTTGTFKSIFGANYLYPFIADGPLRRTLELSPRYLLDDSPAHRQQYMGYRWDEPEEADFFHFGALVLRDPVTYRRLAYFSQGWLMVVPGKKLSPEQLETIFKWGAALSLDLESRLKHPEPLSVYKRQILPPIHRDLSPHLVAPALVCV